MELFVGPLYVNRWAKPAKDAVLGTAYHNPCSGQAASDQRVAYHLVSLGRGSDPGLKALHCLPLSTGIDTGVS